jgi:hypothetical protein
MDWTIFGILVSILGVLLANTGLLFWIGYRLGRVTKTVNFIEQRCPLFKSSNAPDKEEGK